VEIAGVLTFRGETDRAFELLGEASSAGDPALNEVKTDNYFAPLHQGLNRPRETHVRIRAVQADQRWLCRAGGGGIYRLSGPQAPTRWRARSVCCSAARELSRVARACGRPKA